MTENADVEWLRETFGGYIPSEVDAFTTREVYFMQMRRILAHIDQLEAENARLIEVAEDKIDINVRPTVHEIAAQMMAALVASDDRCLLLETLANESYRAAEALVAEGRRRDAAVHN